MLPITHQRWSSGSLLGPRPLDRGLGCMEGDRRAESLLGWTGPQLAPSLQTGRANNWLRGLPRVHRFAGLERNRPRPLSCRARSPSAADPTLPGWTWSRCRGSRGRLQVRPSDGPRSGERSGSHRPRGPSGHLWIRALTPHSALSLNLAVHKHTANSRPSAQVPLALRYTWHSPRDRRLRGLSKGLRAVTDGDCHRFLRGLAGIDQGICAR
jgi:hypothetical protein